MKDLIDRFIQHLFSEPQPIIRDGIDAFIVLFVPASVWLIFNRIVSDFEKRYHDHPVLGKKEEFSEVK